MNSKIHSLTLQSSILAFALIGSGIPIVFENVLAQQDELVEQLQQTNDIGLSQGKTFDSSTDNSTIDDNGGSTDSSGSTDSE